MGLYDPLIDWRDNKWRQADKIVAHFPHRIETYYEPFLGSASVLYQLLGRDISVRRFECSDTCKPLIAFWQVVKDNPSRLVEEYTKNWWMLRRDDKACYEAMKQNFAVSNDPILFFSLLNFTLSIGSMFSETGSFTGRYNRDGRTPESVAKLAEEWGRRFADRYVWFFERDYRQISPKEGDLVYLDPPPAESWGHIGEFDYGELFGWLRQLRCDYFLSLRTDQGHDKQTVEVPAELYNEHVVIKKDLHERYVENLYIRRRKSLIAGSAVSTTGRSKMRGVAQTRTQEPRIRTRPRS